MRCSGCGSEMLAPEQLRKDLKEAGKSVPLRDVPAPVVT